MDFCFFDNTLWLNIASFCFHTLGVVLFRANGFMATVLCKHEPIFKVWLSFRGTEKSVFPTGEIGAYKSDSLSQQGSARCVFKCKAM